MKMNTLEKWVMNSPMRRWALRLATAPLLRRMGGTLEGATALEIGCGRGLCTELILKLFNPAKLIALDIDEEMICRARKRLKGWSADRLELAVGDAAVLDDRPAVVDAIFDFAALHHIPNWQAVLSDLVKRLRPGGRFFFEEACAQWIDRWPYRVLFRHPRENRFSAEAFVAELERNGMEVGGRFRKRGRGDFVLGVGTKKRKPVTVTTEKNGSPVCTVCGYEAQGDTDQDIGWVRGNTERFKDRLFPLWKCPYCESIHSLAPVDFEDIYGGYPLHQMSMDHFARRTLGNLLRRLERDGVRRDHAILDFGCGSGLFLDVLKRKGFTNVVGYDPYVEAFSETLRPGDRFDVVVANDVIEHTANPRETLSACADRLKEGGLLYVGMPESDGVDVKNLEPHVMRCHQPFHRVIVSRRGLRRLVSDLGLVRVRSYVRSYLDTRNPFANYRFLDEFNRVNGHNLDRAMSPAGARVLVRKPWLLFYALGGYWVPSAFEPAVVLRNV